MIKNYYKRILIILTFGIFNSNLIAQMQIDTLIKVSNSRFSYPTWSSDGNTILFESSDEGNWEIYTLNLDSNKFNRITHNKCLDRLPSFSPDNAEIAFVSDRDGDYEVYRMNANGDIQTQLTNNQVNEIHPYWTPNGQYIVFNSQVPGARLYDISMINRDGLMRKQILRDEELNSYAQPSPDGKLIVFDKWYENNEHNGEIYTVNMTGKNLHRLTSNTNIYDGYPAWFPDSERILFSSEVDKTFKLFTIKNDGTGLTQLTFGEGDDQRANVSKTGSKIVFNRNIDNDIDIWTVLLNTKQLEEGALKIDSIFQVTKPEYAYPFWSPDGRKIVYQARLFNNWNIYLRTKDGSHIKKLTDNNANNTNPSWSPDGKSIAFVSDMDGDEEIYIMDTTGRNIQQITNNNRRDIHPYWSPDSKKIIYNTSDQNDNLKVMTVDISSNNEETLIEDEHTNSYASFSPDGKTIAFVKWFGDNGELFIKDVATKKETRLTDIAAFDGYPTWFNDNQTLLFSSNRTGVFKLYTLNIKSLVMDKLSDNSIYPEVRANISRDGTNIIFNLVKGDRLNLYNYILNTN